MASPYSASKAGLIALTKSLGKELSDKNIAVITGGSNGSMSEGKTGRDHGVDQIVGLDKTGNEFIFIEGNPNDGDDYDNDVDEKGRPVALVRCKKERHAFRMCVALNKKYSPLLLSSESRYPNGIENVKISEIRSLLGNNIGQKMGQTDRFTIDSNNLFKYLSLIH